MFYLLNACRRKPLISLLSRTLNFTLTRLREPTHPYVVGDVAARSGLCDFCFVLFVHIVLALRDLAIEQRVCLNHGFIFVSGSRQTCGSWVVWRFDFTQRNGAALFDVFKLKLYPDWNSRDANDYFFKFMLNLYFTCQHILTCVSSPLRYEGKWMNENEYSCAEW